MLDLDLLIISSGSNRAYLSGFPHGLSASNLTLKNRSNISFTFERNCIIQFVQTVKYNMYKRHRFCHTVSFFIKSQVAIRHNQKANEILLLTSDVKSNDSYKVFKMLKQTKGSIKVMPIQIIPFNHDVQNNF